ncbi:hypothetical protein LTR95_016889, partial [Oleoguttula sp. CCFEE 5521]
HYIDSSKHIATNYDREEASPSLSEPTVTRRERKIQLTYDLPHRIRCAAIYPLPAPNGSTVILYGNDRGLRVLWRGGRRIKAADRPPPLANSANDVIMIDDSDDEPAAPPPPQKVEYEDDEEEPDEETPYPSIIQEMDIPLGSPVLHLAIPSLPPDAKQRADLKDIVKVTTCDDALTQQAGVRCPHTRELHTHGACISMTVFTTSRMSREAGSHKASSIEMSIGRYLWGLPNQPKACRTGRGVVCHLIVEISNARQPSPNNPAAVCAPSCPCVYIGLRTLLLSAYMLITGVLL